MRCTTAGPGGAKSGNAAGGSGNGGNDTPVQPKSQPSYQQQNYQQQANYQQPQSQVVYHQQPSVQTVYAGFDENNIPENTNRLVCGDTSDMSFAIPLVGFIVLLVFAFGGTRNKNLKNFCEILFLCNDRCCDHYCYPRICSWWSGICDWKQQSQILLIVSFDIRI